MPTPNSILPFHRQQQRRGEIKSGLQKSSDFINCTIIDVPHVLEGDAAEGCHATDPCQHAAGCRVILSRSLLQPHAHISSPWGGRSNLLRNMQ